MTIGLGNAYSTLQLGSRGKESLISHYPITFFTPVMAESSPPPTRRFQAVPMEETVKKVRRFAPEPVETTSRSSKRDNGHRSIDATIERKDFAGKRRFAPIPVETTFKSSRVQPGKVISISDPTQTSIPLVAPIKETPKPRRRFTPELIETSKRSKRAGDARPATLPTDKVNTSGMQSLFIHANSGLLIRQTSLLEYRIYTHDHRKEKIWRLY